MINWVFVPDAKKEAIILSQNAYAVDLTERGKQAESIPANRQTEIQLVDFILNSLRGDKAEDIVRIDLAGKSDMADHMVIASGRSTRQVISISEKLIERLKHQREIQASVEGKEHGDWVLIDAGDAIIHIFRPEVRDFYQLEKLWMPSIHDGDSE